MKPDRSSTLALARLATAPGDAVEKLSAALDFCVSYAGAASGRIYALCLAPFCYRLLASRGSDDAPRTLPASVLNAIERRPSSILERVMRENRVVRLSRIAPKAHFFLAVGARAGSESRLVVPISRRGQCLGMIDLDSPVSEHFTLEHQEVVEIAAEVSLVLLEKDDTLALLKTLPQPVDFRVSQETFHEELMKLTVKASRMPFIALREWEPEKDQLTCIALSGFQGATKDDLHWTPLSKYPSFEKAVLQGETVVENNMTEAYLEPMRRHDHLHEVKSFVVVPVKVGDRIFGTLSFASPCELQYTGIELRSFETLANALGVSITNWRNFHAAEAKLFNEAKASAAIGAVEVAQAARHEIENHIHAAQINLRLIVDTSRTAPQKSPLAAIHNQASKVSELLQKVLASADKIKTTARPPKRDYCLVDIAQLWAKALDLTVGRLVDNEIRHHLSGKAETMGYPEWLVHAFLHLVYNSIDAFMERPGRRDRRITITIDPQGALPREIVIRYTDNAGGIDPSKLMPPMPEGERLNNYIFEKDVTSKEKGSGYGMFLVRKILDDHHGSIDLVDYRNGVVFDLRLPRVVQKVDGGR